LKSFKLDVNALIVNDEKQDDNVYQKLKEKYMKKYNTEINYNKGKGLGKIYKIEEK